MSCYVYRNPKLWAQKKWIDSSYFLERTLLLRHVGRREGGGGGKEPWRISAAWSSRKGRSALSSGATRHKLPPMLPENDRLAQWTHLNCVFALEWVIREREGRLFKRRIRASKAGVIFRPDQLGASFFYPRLQDMRLSAEEAFHSLFNYLN